MLFGTDERSYYHAEVSVDFNHTLVYDSIMHITVLPKTTLGRWLVGLAITFLYYFSFLPMSQLVLNLSVRDLIRFLPLSWQSSSPAYQELPLY